jgi:hypothetical protein
MTHEHGHGELNIKKFAGGGALFTGGAAVGVLGVGAALAGAFGAFGDAREGAFAYLTAYMFGLSVAFGALFFLTVTYAMRAKWPIPLRRITESMASTVVLFAVLFIPIALNLDKLYPWIEGSTAYKAVMADPVAAKDLTHAISVKGAFLNTGFFLGRAAVYFLIWIAAAFGLRAVSLREDDDASKVKDSAKFSMVALFLLFLLMTSLTGAVIDWVMSLTPAWFSTMFGVYYFAGAMLGSFAVHILLTRAAQNNGYLDGLIDPKGSHFHALGRLLFGFIVFWAYIAWSQGFIIYIANKPEETPWYITRLHGGWGTFFAFLLIGHFLVPFLILLFRSVKFRPGALSVAAVWMLFMQFVDLYWLIMPTVNPEFSFNPVALVGGIGMLGLAAAVGTRMLNGKLFAPKNDPMLHVGRRYHSP